MWFCYRITFGTHTLEVGGQVFLEYDSHEVPPMILVLQFEINGIDAYFVAGNFLLNCSSDLRGGSSIGRMAFTASTRTHPHNLVGYFVVWEH